jgi:N-acetylglucosamine kinase-like BadF-type ATPase
VKTEPVILGVDGGGTRSSACLWIGGREVARTGGAALNPNHAGVAGSREAMSALLASLRMPIPHSEQSPIDAACVGLSGLSHPSSGTIVKEAFETANLPVRGPRILVSDAELLLAAAFGEARPSGVALLCGTGTIALARDAGGRVVRAGGAGPARGDEGGAHWIGREAVARGVLGGVPEGSPPASLAPAVLAAAQAGDPRAGGILRDAARACAAIVAEVARAAGLRGPFEVRPAGGVASHAPQLLAFLADELARLVPDARLGPLVADPLPGALALATRALASGSSVPPGW